MKLSANDRAVALGPQSAPKPIPDGFPEDYVAPIKKWHGKEGGKSRTRHSAMLGNAPNETNSRENIETHSTSMESSRASISDPVFGH